ncbi:MAG: hypothetical protein O7E52_08045, partial [Candidatus Poribacteria bacterium]|nr:hypothetical protein [Candidatus Poribacteria bacterium]
MSIENAEFDEIDDPRHQQKLWELRSSLLGHRQTYGRKRKAGLGFKVWVPLLLLATVGYHVAKNAGIRGAPPPLPLKKQAISVALPKAPLDFALLASAREVSAATNRASTPEFRAAETSAASLSVRVWSPAAERGKALSSAETLAPEVAPATTLPSAHGPTSGVAPLATPKTAVVTAAGSKPSSPATPPLSGIEIIQSLACLEVEARQCIGDQSVFALNEHNNPHIWMNVHSQSLPYVLKHIYYHEGRKYTEIPLVIKYPR